MANADLLNLIAVTYPQMTRAEKKVADVVLHDPQSILNATITDLAELCDVGDTSVFRFCRTLKLNGYQDFKVSLALSTNGTSIGTTHCASGADGTTTPSDRVQNAYLKAVSDTIVATDTHAVAQAVRLMDSALSIHFFGVGSSGVAAFSAQNRFLRITPKVSFQMDAHAQLNVASLIHPSSVAIIFSNSGTTKDCIEIARLAKENGASVIFITKFAKTPAAVYADVILLCGAVEGPLQGGSIEGRISQLYATDILYAEYSARMGSQAVANKKKTATTIAEKML